MEKAESWQKAEIPGPMKALVITKPEIVIAMMKRAKRPLLIVGHEAVEGDLEEKPIDYAISIARTGIPVVATSHMVGEFIKRGFQPAGWMPIVDIANRLQDPTWQGIEGKGQHDFALFMGLPYYLQWLTLSALKHFAPYLKTVSLDRFYQPHATWSFPNISLKKWQESLKKIAGKLE